MQCILLLVQVAVYLPAHRAPHARGLVHLRSRCGLGHTRCCAAEETTAVASTGVAHELVDMSMTDLGLRAERPTSLPQRGVFCTRTLDMRGIKGIGYDMDYTLIDYKMILLEERVYHYSKEFLRSKGFPVSGLTFDHDTVVRGLAIDRQLGNTLKVDRFGYVQRATHGTTELSPAEIAEVYGGVPPIDLRDSRWIFLNTLFSVSEGCLYAQLVDRLDSGELLQKCQDPFDATRCSTYEQLYSAVSRALFKAHVQGTMKAEVMQDPLRFVNVDPAYARTLLDQRAAGKKLMLITNSDWVYTSTMMHAIYDASLPQGKTWRDLFDLVIVSACKPEFFDGSSRRPVYEIATPDGMLRESYKFEEGKQFAGGYATLVEKCFGISGPEMLYIGDHLFTDVNMAKRELSWRTCLILQELEAEMSGMERGEADAQKLTTLLKRKDLQAAYVNYLRTRLHDASPLLTGMPPLDKVLKSVRSPPGDPSTAAEDTRDASAAAHEWNREEVLAALDELEGALEDSEREIAALVYTEGNHVNRVWGYMSRAGFADKSHMMRQIEKYADIYTSRVSNLLPYTPYKKFLCPRQSLAHSTSSLMEHWRIFPTVEAVDE